MRKLLDIDILDIVPVESGFIYLCRETMPDGGEAGIFHMYDKYEDCIVQASVSDYLYAKFGPYGKDISLELGDFITCKCAELFDGGFIAFYPDGSFKLLYDERLAVIDELTYLDCPVCSPATNGRDLWLAVPEANAIINYSLEHGRVELRIGGPNTKAFCHPVCLTVCDDYLYICNEYSYKIRRLNLTSYTVEDYKMFDEEIKMYFRSGDDEYVVLKSGVYSL